ncbi:MAG: DUF4147 domain-containing protein [Myxococcales bacterium]|nr:DUF4147 domain-containing protein [Myxococcales bacterium]
MAARHRIQNRAELLGVEEPTRARRQRALELCERLLDSLDPYEATRRSLRAVFPRGICNGRSHVLAIGKAAVAMARAALDEVGARSGFVLAPEPASEDLSPLILLRGGHPSPCAEAPAHAQQVLAHLQRLGAGEQLLCLISGGGSALFELPRAGLRLEDLARTGELLMHGGASIQALNLVRRSLSQVKGGGVLRACPNLAVTNFILSDVVGGPLYAVASGPTLPIHDPSANPLALLEDFGVRSATPGAVIALLEADARRAHPSSAGTERLQATERRFSPPNMRIPAATPPTWVVADNDRAVRLVEQHASDLGLALQVLPGHLEGDAATAGAGLSTRFRGGGTGSFVWGGETTVRIDAPNPGRGGRNQELILGAARSALAHGSFSGTLVALGSDGVDGRSPAAGALLDAEVLQRLSLTDVEAALDGHDSYTLLEGAGAALITGPTGTNVADLCFWLA